MQRFRLLTLLVAFAACAANSTVTPDEGSGGNGGAGGSGGIASGGTAVMTTTGGSTGQAGAPAGRGGSAGSGVMSSGGAAGVAPSPVVPALAGTNYRFTFDGFVFEVDPATGARVTVFSLDGKNILTGPAQNPDNYGSTFWPSPQAAWGWPPPAEIDPGAFAARVDGATLVLEGKPSAKVNLTITKRISVDRAANAVLIAYEMKNTAAAVATWAPWEITRVPAGGVTLFAAGAGGTAAIGTWVPTPLDEADGWRWFDDAALQIPDKTSRKTFADGKGWIAHVARDQRLVLIKTFEDVAQNAQAKDEAELEIFVDSARKYVEVENQGAALPLAPGAVRAWTVKWSLRALPAAGALGVGTTAIVDAVKAVVSR